MFGLLINSGRNALRTHGPVFKHFLISRDAVIKHHAEVNIDRAVEVTRAYIERSNQHMIDLLEAHQIELPSH